MNHRLRCNSKACLGTRAPRRPRHGHGTLHVLRRPRPWSRSTTPVSTSTLKPSRAARASRAWLSDHATSNASGLPSHFGSSLLTLLTHFVGPGW